MRARRLLVLLVLLAVGAVAPALGAEPTEYVVVVHPENPVEAIERHRLANMFLKRVSEWPDGQPVEPVDQSSRSRIRGEFVRAVLHRSVGAVRSYWQQQIFSGRSLPPPELDSDADVVRYVLGHRGAVGYVSRSAVLGGAKIVMVRGEVD